MKRRIITIVSITIIAFVLGFAVYAQNRTTENGGKSPQNRSTERAERHRLREQHRAERLAEYERFVDSIVLARNFKFVPQNIEQEPAGTVRMLNNPSYQLSIWGSEVDVCLPYIKGTTPPYYFVLLNYTLPSVQRYVTQQTNEGWHVTFTTSLFSASDYDFSLDIYTSSGSATLTIASTWYPDVSYDGSIIDQD